MLDLYAELWGVLRRRGFGWGLIFLGLRLGWGKLGRVGGRGLEKRGDVGWRVVLDFCVVGGGGLRARTLGAHRMLSK